MAKQWRSLAFFLAFAVLVAGCGPDSASPGTPAPVPTSPTTQTTRPTQTPSTVPPASSTTVAATTSTALPGWVDIVMEGGVPRDGVADVEVARGDTVRLRVVSDVTDHVHVHGFDLFFDLAPGEPVEIVFVATGLGVFEIELEHTHTPIVKLTVR